MSSNINAPGQRHYTVMTDSRFYMDKTKFARKKPDCSRKDGFWTSVAPEDVWIMDHETALDVVSRLHHNNPRVVRADKAIAQIEAQRDAKIRLKEAADNPVIIITGDWYERRDELEEGMVFTTGGGELVKLDREVPGDATKWFVAT